MTARTQSCAHASKMQSICLANIANHNVTSERHPLPRRILLLSGIVAYVALFGWIYEYYLYPTWDYYGFHYYPPPWPYLALGWLFSVMPGLWMPVELIRPSQLAYWVLYITVFIPSMFVPLYLGLDTPDEISLLMVTLFAGFAIIGGCYVLPLFRLGPARISRNLFWKWFGFATAALALWLLVVFRSHMQFLSFNDIYDLRYIQNDVSEGTFVNYAFMLLTGAFNPFLIAFGLFRKRKWVLAAGVLGQLLVYVVGGTKGSILSIIFIPGFYALLRSGPRSFGLKIIFGTLGIAAALCFSYRLAGYEPEPLQLHWLVLFVVLMRTLSANAMLTGWYYNYFQTNPHTFFSHVRGVDWFVHYPYQKSVAMEIGSVYMGPNDPDPTAHFWATDGIGGLGLPGILVVSALCAAVFWALDSASQRHDPRLAALVTTYAAYNISNISLFTSLFSGGLAVLIVLLYLMPSEPPAVIVASARKRNHKLYQTAATPPAALREEGE